MLFLIDGYNLLHAMGILQGRAGPNGLEKARRNLLGLLTGVYGAEARSVTVVFDAAKAPRGLAAEYDFQGIHVSFAVDQEEADDLIEYLIRRAATPRQLTVVSDDHRIQQAARRRRCVVQGCTEYLDWLDRHRQQRRQPPATTLGKPTVLSVEETNHWLDEFADLAKDPNIKELFDPHGFLEDEQ